MAAGGQVDYTNVQQGDAVTVDLGLVYRLGRHLRFEVDNLHETMDVDQRLAVPGQHRAARRAPGSSTSGHSFAPSSSTSFTTTTPSSTRTVGALRDEELYAQLLFSYKVNPRTVVFVGYSEDSRGDATYDLTPAIKSVFVKLGYAWVP